MENNIYFYNQHGALFHVCPDKETALERINELTGCKFTLVQLDVVLRDTKFEWIRDNQRNVIYLSEKHTHGVLTPFERFGFAG